MIPPSTHHRAPRLLTVALVLLACASLSVVHPSYAAPQTNAFAAPTAPPPVTFTGPTNFAVGDVPNSLAVGDFNGDGHPDLAVALNGGSVAVLLGNGQGSFTGPTNFAVCCVPASVAVADFNGDHHLDLVTANASSNNVAVLFGNGRGTFSHPFNFAVGSQPSAVVVRDFNGDGHLDLAVANYGSNTVSVLFGNGHGKFSRPFNFATDSGPISVVAHDFNGDGHLDLAVANYGSNTVSVLFGNGHGKFSRPFNFATDSGPISIVAHDFNGDEHPDIVTANLNSNSATVLLGDGTGRFAYAPTLFFNPFFLPGSVATGDFNDDHHPDLAIVDSGLGSGPVEVLLGDGTGKFPGRSDYLVGAVPLSVVAGDFNQDGRPDLATGNAFSNDVSVLLNTTH